MDPLTRSLLLTGGSRPRPTYIGYEKTEITTNGTSLSINVPAGTQNGDLMVACLGGGGGSNNVGDWVNTNFTFRVEETTLPNIVIATRIANSEGSSVTFTTSASVRLSGVLMTFRNASWGVTGTVGTGNSNTPTAPSITVPEPNSIGIGIWGSDGSNRVWTNSSGWTQVDELVQDGNSHTWFVARQNLEAGATGSISNTLNSAQNWQCAIASISPA